MNAIHTERSSIQGFTLIELMIVVAIIAILAAIALSAYEIYVGRSQATVGLADMRGSEVTFEEQIQNGDGAGSPANANTIGLPLNTTRCSDMTPGGNCTAKNAQTSVCTLASNLNVVG